MLITWLRLDGVRPRMQFNHRNWNGSNSRHQEKKHDLKRLTTANINETVTLGTK